MKKNIFRKVKKIGFYVFAGIGIIGVLLFVGVVCSFVFKKSIDNASPEELFSSGKTLEFQSGETVGSSAGMDSNGVTSELTQQRELIDEGELTERKVIRDGSLLILVQKTEEVAENIQNIAQDLDGFVSYSRIYEVSEGTKSGVVTIRVPANFFDQAINEIKELAIKVEDENTNSSDVTERFIDLEARLGNLEVEEEQYIQVMEKAKTVEDILMVSQRLSSVRGKIEQIKGQLKYLSNQIDMSTITVTITAEEDVELFGIRWRPLYIVKQSFRNMLSGFRGYLYALIKFVFTVPILILWLGSISLSLFGIWKFLKWMTSYVKKQKSKKR